MLLETLDSAPVTAALIASATAIVGFAVQGWFLNSRIERIRHGNSMELAEQTSQLQYENSKRFEEFRKSIELTFQSKQDRRDSLHRLLNAASIAHSGSRQLLKTARLRYPEDREELFKEASEGFQQLSVFFPAVTHAGLDDNLTQKDMDFAVTLQAHVFEFFFRLDLNRSGTDDYENELSKFYTPVHSAYTELENHVVQRKSATVSMV